MRPRDHDDGVRGLHYPVFLTVTQRHSLAPRTMRRVRAVRAMRTVRAMRAVLRDDVAGHSTMKNESRSIGVCRGCGAVPVDLGGRAVRHGLRRRTAYGGYECRSRYSERHEEGTPVHLDTPFRDPL